ncbi:Ser/Thr protein phosphatase [Tritrichomonas foetus]|uniref:Serine/threonine-protein phosphatase n=1 Tax=Tritrichomonas foetus TaxID=1144522 RepID=A0A1J4L2R6_9EUKA|nr:Ser/Thr protein phosphatase [Tritrichomonas foetus]|eukprot:OHT16189.1 Ser/Thr protein phosphatase [Tritrichomonas foetus]
MRRGSDTVILGFQHLMGATEAELKSVGDRSAIPQFPPEIVKDLFSESYRILSNRNIAVIEIEAPFYIIGDLHGNLIDLLRIFSLIYMSNEIRIVFLGDYVDRGHYSLEVLLLILALKCKYPSSVYLLRGNHEFVEGSHVHSLVDNLKSCYANDYEQLYSMAADIFSYLPIAAIISNQILCIHGGLSPKLRSLSDLYKIKLPIKTYLSDPLVADLLWSDPCPSIPFFVESHRGVGRLFGQQAAAHFMAKNGITLLIRAHQCVCRGVEQPMNGVVTVFSTSCYDETENMAGFLYIEPDLSVKCSSISPFKSLPREKALFADSSFFTGKSFYHSRRNSTSNSNTMGDEEVGLASSRESGTNELSSAGPSAGATPKIGRSRANTGVSLTANKLPPLNMGPPVGHSPSMIAARKTSRNPALSRGHNTRSYVAKCMSVPSTSRPDLESPPRPQRPCPLLVSTIMGDQDD